MAQIKLNVTMLEKVLYEVVQKNFDLLGETYLVIEDINIFADEIDKEAANPPFSYLINGHYGYKDEPKKQFRFVASSEWDYNFIAGYFTHIVQQLGY